MGEVEGVGGWREEIATLTLTNQFILRVSDCSYFGNSFMHDTLRESTC
jgi:hypothetical protein